MLGYCCESCYEYHLLCHRSNSAKSSKIRSDKGTVSINYNGVVSKGFLKHQLKYFCKRAATIAALMRRV